jgi:hypothetical protein
MLVARSVRLPCSTPPFSFQTPPPSFWEPPFKLEASPRPSRLKRGFMRSVEKIVPHGTMRRFRAGVANWMILFLRRISLLSEKGVKGERNEL